MRRSALPLRSALQQAGAFIGLMFIVIGPAFLVHALIANHLLPRSLSTPLQVIAIIGSMVGTGIVVAQRSSRRKRALRLTMDSVKSWALANGFGEASPHALPPGEQPQFRGTASKLAGYVAQPLTIHTIPFTVEGNLRVAEAYTRTAGSVEVSLVYVAVEPPPSPQGRRALTSLRYTVVMASGLRNLPQSWIEPQGKGDAALLALGAQDVDVESAAFNDEWRVFTTDTRAAHGFLSPRVIDHLVEASAGSYSIALEGGHMVTAVSGWAGGVEEVKRLVHLVTGLVERLPQGYHMGTGAGIADSAVSEEETAIADVDAHIRGEPQKSQLRYTKAHQALSGLLTVVGLTAVAYPFFTIPGPGEEFHWFKLVMLFGGGVLLFTGGKIARFVLGDQRALRGPRGRAPRNPS